MLIKMTLVLYWVNSVFVKDNQRGDIIHTFSIWCLESLYYYKANSVIFASLEWIAVKKIIVLKRWLQGSWWQQMLDSHTNQHPSPVAILHSNSNFRTKFSWAAWISLSMKRNYVTPFTPRKDAECYGKFRCKLVKAWGPAFIESTPLSDSCSPSSCLNNVRDWLLLLPPQTLKKDTHNWVPTQRFWFNILSGHCDFQMYSHMIIKHFKVWENWFNVCLFLGYLLLMRYVSNRSSLKLTLLAYLIYLFSFFLFILI